METTAEANQSSTLKRIVKFKKSDAPENISERVVIISNDAFNAHNVEKDIAAYIKRKADEEFTMGGSWHCVVGRNFGCSITHDTKNLLFFEMENKNILLFQSFNNV